MHLSPPVAEAAVRSKAVVLFLIVYIPDLCLLSYFGINGDFIVWYRNVLPLKNKISKAYNSMQNVFAFL